MKFHLIVLFGTGTQLPHSTVFELECKYNQIEANFAMKSIVIRALGAVILASLLYFALVFGVVLKSDTSPQSARGKDELLKIARQSKPIITALQQYYRQNRHYPAKLTGVLPYLSKPERDDVSGNTWRGWEYDGTASPDPRQITVCGLWITVWNRDSLLRCECLAGAENWKYDPQDGSPKTPLPFHLDETAR